MRPVSDDVVTVTSIVSGPIASPQVSVPLLCADAGAGRPGSMNREANVSAPIPTAACRRKRRRETRRIICVHPQWSPDCPFTLQPAVRISSSSHTSTRPTAQEDSRTDGNPRSNPAQMRRRVDRPRVMEIEASGGSSMEGGEFKGKTAVVTGGASGIGRAILEAFVHHGATGILADIDAEWGVERADALRGEGHDVTFIKTDVRKSDQVARLFEIVGAQHRGIDILVNRSEEHTSE